MGQENLAWVHIHCLPLFIDFYYAKVSCIIYNVLLCFQCIAKRAHYCEHGMCGQSTILSYSYIHFIYQKYSCPLYIYNHPPCIEVKSHYCEHGMCGQNYTIIQLHTLYIPKIFMPSLLYNHSTLTWLFSETKIQF